MVTGNFDDITEVQRTSELNILLTYIAFTDSAQAVGVGVTFRTVGASLVQGNTSDSVSSESFDTATATVFARSFSPTQRFVQHAILNVACRSYSKIHLKINKLGTISKTLVTSGSGEQTTPSPMCPIGQTQLLVCLSQVAFA